MTQDAGNLRDGVDYDLVDELFSGLEGLLPIARMDELEERLEGGPCPREAISLLGDAYRRQLEALAAPRLAALLAAGAKELPMERREELVGRYAALVRGTQEGFRAYLVPWPACRVAFEALLDDIARQADAYAGVAGTPTEASG